MRFEKFLLDNYIASEEGQKIYTLFQNIRQILASGDETKELTTFINSLLNQPIAEQFFVFEKFDDEGQGELSFPPFAEFEEYYTDIIENILESWKADYRNILGDIPSLSLNFFYLHAPYYAFPYLYPVHFNIFHAICNEFEIFLPVLPGVRQYKERCYYYLELCRSLYDFRQKYELSPEELCVFLYGFAQKFIKSNQINELPEPNKVWFVGAGKYDIEHSLPTFDEKSIFHWAGRTSMTKGDIVFIYECAPNSKISMFSRAISDGYDDPFHYYSGKIWLSHTIRITGITFKELKENTHFSEHGLIKAHMQGLASGRQISNADYLTLKNMLKNKAFDTSSLPETVSYSMKIDKEINDERDVELYLLEPFLEKLGVQQKHITRQMPLRMGRGIRYYPDYVINAVTTRGAESGKFIWEAKYRIVSQKDLTEAFAQAKSYALRLSADGLGLVSYEGIWIALASDKYHSEKIQHFSWIALEDKDTLQNVSDILKKHFGKLLK